MNIRTDLAVEAHEMCSKRRAEKNSSLEGIAVTERRENGLLVTEIAVTDRRGAEILAKPEGRYITITAPGLKYSDEIYKSACTALCTELRALYPITPKTKTLVCGLGNRRITPDAIGPEAVARLLVTNHLKERPDCPLEYEAGSVCAITPGVLGTTGIETTDIIKGVADRIKPDLIIAVDALAARSVSRIAETIQLTDTGISPGSGVENKRAAVNEEALGVKVIAVGVPTVADAATVAADSIDMAFGEGGDKSGIIRRALSENAANLMVTPKDIDLIISRAAGAAACGINMALHPGMSFEEAESCAVIY